MPIHSSARCFAALFTAACLSLSGHAAEPLAKHVLLVVWDGMRPDFVTAANTPHLHALAQRGTFFAKNHAFWITTTEVNGTVLATGAFPSRSSIVANREYRPDIDPRHPVPTEALETVRRGDALTGGHYLGALTVAEIARRAGFSTAIAGTKDVALLHDRSPDRPATPFSAIVFAGHVFPKSLLAPLTDALGPFPPYITSAQDPKPYTDGNRWTTRALVEHLWRDAIPRYSVLWLSDPDYPQHITAPGSPTALAGIRDSDTHLGLALAELEKRGVLAATDIFVVSDHGFSTTERTVDPVKYFNDGGVSVVQQFNSPPAPGSAIYVNISGSSSLYVTGHDPATIEKLVTLLQKSDFAGPIFTREPLPGTFPLQLAHLDSPAAPDIVFSFRWREGKNAHGTSGLIVAENQAGTGAHGTLSPYDIHNTLIAAGPDIRPGFRDEFPTGNIDVAPTLLHLLGLDPPDESDGRVLTEALLGTPAPAESPVPRRLEASRQFPGGWFRRNTTWQQSLQTTTFAGKIYFDEGNAETLPR